MSWRIRGSYFESCNCDPICPCRRIDGSPGGRSTLGVCMGVLSWLIDDGTVDGTDVSGMPVALALRYSDDEQGSPWTWILYLDASASQRQRASLEAVFTGRLGGDAQSHFPWTWSEASELVAVRPVTIEVDHLRRRQWLRIRDCVSVRIRDRYPRQRGGHLCHPRPRPRRRGAGGQRAHRRRRPPRIQLPRCLRLRIDI
jgi:hypothetical protein